MRNLLFFVLLATASAIAAESAVPQLSPEQLVARVNGAELRGAALNDYVDAVLPNFSFHAKADPAKVGEYRRAALERMVLHELIYQDARRRGITVPPQVVDQELAQMRGRFRSAQTFERALARRGFTLAALRAQIARNHMVAEVVRRDVSARSRSTHAQARAYYRDHLDRFREPEAVLVRHIRLAPAGDARTRAQGIRALALVKNTSEEFDRLARQYSADDYRVMGGLLGWVHHGRLEPELDKVAFSLAPGEVSPVIETAGGFHLLRVEGKRPQRLVPFNDVRDKIRSQLEAERTKRERERLRARLYKNARVEILARF